MLALSVTTTSNSCFCSSLFFTKDGCLRKGDRNPTEHHQQQQHGEPKFLRWLAPPAMAAILTLSTPCFITSPASQAQPVDAPKGAALFQKACIGCHVGGGNILSPGATLFMKDLERNNVGTEEDIYNITYYGKGRMPGFGEKCTPRGQCTFGPRLHDEEIKLLANFVKTQAEKGWPNIESYGD